MEFISRSHINIQDHLRDISSAEQHRHTQKKCPCMIHIQTSHQGCRWQRLSAGVPLCCSTWTPNLRLQRENSRHFDSVDKLIFLLTRQGNKRSFSEPNCLRCCFGKVGPVLVGNVQIDCGIGWPSRLKSSIRLAEAQDFWLPVSLRGSGCCH